MLLIEGMPNSRAVTIFVRGGNKMVGEAAALCCDLPCGVLPYASRCLVSCFCL
jgi:hypothetical protein